MRVLAVIKPVNLEKDLLLVVVAAVVSIVAASNTKHLLDFISNILLLYIIVRYIL